ncbi:MAG: outer membrane lipoprotein-sorting protein [Halioglobus sp.]|nr:outer membrane lipoprotein-sorting protein [Halioglobus sp.]
MNNTQVSNTPANHPALARSLALLLLCCIALPGAPIAFAEPEAEKGLAIAVEADRRDTGFGDTSVDLTMLIASSPDNIITREMRQMVLEVAGDGDKSIMVFDRPRDLKGTAILTFTHKTEADEQWLYLPALKRVKRISSADKSGPFMGSEFAYEDLSSQEVEKYSYKYLRDETINGELCFVLERIPTDANSGYTRQVTWVDQSEYRQQRVDYYDRKGALLKTMIAVDYEQYLDHYWRPGELIMTNHQTGKSTTLKFGNYQFRTGLQDSDFTPSAIARIR